MACVIPNQELKLDSFQTSAFLSYFRSLPLKTSTTLRFFDRADYYTLHGSDAIFIANSVLKSTSQIKYIGTGDKKVETVLLNKSNFEATVRDLLLFKQYRVEVYQNKGGKSNEWSLTYKASPGNLSQYEDLFANNDISSTVGVLAVQVHYDGSQKIIGLGYVDTIDCKMIVSEFVDNDQFSNLEAAIVQLGPKECLIEAKENNLDIQRVQSIMERSGILVSDRKKGDFNTKDCIQDLNRLLKSSKNGVTNAATHEEIQKKHGMGSLSAVIRFLELLSDESNFEKFSLSTFDLSQYMKLDTAAVQALNILPNQNEGGNMNQSLSGLLNKCRTPQGQRLLGQWLKQPLMDINKIEERLNMVEFLMDNTVLRHTLHDDLLRRIPDFQRLAKKFLRKKATLQDCYRVYQALEKIPYLLEALEEGEGQHRSLLLETLANPTKELLHDFGKFQEMVEATLDLERVESHEFMIKPDFDENLLELRGKLDQIEGSIKSQLNKVARDLRLEAGKVLKLESNHQLGFYFRLSRKDEKAIRGNRSYIVIDTKKDGVRFRTNSVIDLNDEYLSKKSEYSERQKSIVMEVISIASGYSEPMCLLSDIVAQVDVLVSFAHVSANAPVPFTRPKFHPKGSGILKLRQCRHPCLEMQDDVAFIPNDVAFAHDQHMFHIITGPNMGGKSTYIRSVGTVVFMAQLGCFVPCDDAEISVIDCILARVGASDSHLKGVSTFMAEMLETASILKSATKDSLIIIDELGRGTSTYDGFGLAWAIAEHIVKEIGCFTLFATHFHELTDLADENAAVNNLHVTALTSDSSLTLLYRVKPGKCDQSFGIHVAECVYFPEHIIQFAKQKASDLEDFQNTDGCHQEELNEPSLKKHKINKKETDETMYIFLDEVKKMPMDEMTDDEISKALQKLKDGMTHRNM